MRNLLLDKSQKHEERERERAPNPKPKISFAFKRSYLISGAALKKLQLYYYYYLSLIERKHNTSKGKVTNES